MDPLALISSISPRMDVASILIRNLDPKTKERLRVRAARNSRSMEDEARTILRAALATGPERPRNLAESIARKVRAFGGVDLQVPERQPQRVPPKPGR